VGADSPDEVAAAVDDLRDRVQTLEEQQQVLAEAGYDRPEHVLDALASMEDQLDELYGEKQATERSTPETEFVDGDTFDQLQALMAREEKLQRELGVSSPDAVVEMVEGLSDQLEDVYQDRDAASTGSIFAPAPEASSDPATDALEEEFGVSDPDALLTMMNDLKDQLDELYADRRRLAEHNLDGADDAIRMLESMRQQLESLYEGQVQMSEHGIDGMDHALSMIDNMEAQLSALYDERHRLAQDDASGDAGDLAGRIERLEEKLGALRDEKEALREKRDQLQAQLGELEAEFGTDDPDAISDLIESLETQLNNLYAEREEDARRHSLPSDEPLLPADTLSRLGDLDNDALDDLPVGVFGLDEQGKIRRVNENVLRWPDVDVESPSALLNANFFEDVAPATNNALFRGRFQDGVEAGRLDEHFPYTYVGEEAPPTNLAIHLHSAPDEAVYWVVFRTL
jgi:photoactive yellow protein